MAKTYVMEKLDALTPWHALQQCDSEQEAKFAAYVYAKGRAKNQAYPKYAVNGMEF